MKAFGTFHHPSVSSFFRGAIVLSAFVATGVTARDIYVATNGADTAADSWATAYSEIQTALDVAASNDIIHVAGQTFVLTNALSWTASFTQLKGGYAATNATGPGPCDPDQWPTLITRDPAYPTRLLDMHNVTNATIENLTFQGGSLTDTFYGGGMYASSVTNLVLRSCRFLDNFVSGSWGQPSHGAGLAALNTFGIITNVLFQGNTVVGGGYDPGNGGGAYLSGGSLVVTDCRFIANEANGGRSNPGRGAACSIGSGKHTFHNVLAVLNRTIHWTSGHQGQGGGFHLAAAAQTTLLNATILGNEPDGIHNLSSGTVVSNSIVYRNTTADIGGSVTPSLSHSCIGDGTGAGANGNFAGDPRFAEEWFYLASDSPCVDAGGGTAAEAGLDARTTRADGTVDTGDVDLGYHYAAGAAPFDILYVSPDGDDANDGTGWGDALQTITHALETAGDRVRIYLDSGNYDNAGETFPLALQERTAQVIGTNSETTVIDATGAGNRVFLFERTLGPNRIEGITVRGGSGFNGGGIQVSDSLLSILRSDIVKNSSTDNGGGIYAEKSSVILSDSKVHENTAYGSWKDPGYGGGIYTRESVCVVSNSIFGGNLARGNTGGAIGAGGAAHFFRSGATMSNCSLTNNTAQYGKSGNTAYGGGVFVSLGRMVLRNLLVAGNVSLAGDPALPHGGGIYAAAGNVTLESSTIVTNTGGAGLQVGSADVNVLNSILWDNVGGNVSNLVLSAISYSCAPELTHGVGNITNAPVFVDAEAGDYRLTKSSPGVNEGQTLGWMLLPEAIDLAGEPRVLNDRVDMGAYETYLPPAGSIIRIR